MNGFINLNQITSVSVVKPNREGAKYKYYVTLQNDTKCFGIGCKNQKEAEDKLNEIEECFKNNYGFLRIRQEMARHRDIIDE